MAEAKVHAYKLTLAKRAPFEATVILKPSREMKMGTEHKVVLTHKVDNQVVGGVTLNVRITPALNMPDAPPNALASLQQHGSLPFYKFLREWGIERIEECDVYAMVMENSDVSLLQKGQTVFSYHGRELLKQGLEWAEKNGALIIIKTSPFSTAYTTEDINTARSLLGGL